MNALTIPIPNNPQHVDNLKSIELLAAQNFEGIDKSLSISLFEYGLAWRKLENGEYLFIYSNPHHEGYFNRQTISEKIDFKKEFNWICWADVANYLGCPLENWLDCSFPQKIYDLFNYYGNENIFGTDYWQGFKVTEITGCEGDGCDRECCTHTADSPE